MLCESPFASTTEDVSIFESAVRAVKESLGMKTGLIPDDLIKRVMALPGETIEIHDDRIGHRARDPVPYTFERSTVSVRASMPKVDASS